MTRCIRRGAGRLLCRLRGSERRGPVAL